MFGPAAQPLWIGASLAGAVALLALLVWVYIRRAALWPAQSEDHGITVGAAKVYDNRSLLLMLEQLREQLRNLQNLDSKKVSDGIGAQQSAETEETSIALSAGKAEEKSGDKSPDSKSPDSTAGEPATPKLSERASDLLADQVNLYYDIFNLRLMLERAISDRIMTDGDPRIQAVVGFPISIDPRAFAAGCAAIVEVELSGAADQLPGESPLSLIALFPQEETRNASIVTSRQASLGGSAEASGVPVGAAYHRSRSMQAIRRESDTVALERPPRDRNSVRFAWEFRPTMGSPSVAPGVRQMLAVISINEPDTHTAGKPYVDVSVKVRSYWRSFHLATQTLSSWSGWRTLLTKGPTETKWQPQANIHVLSTDDIVNGLAPARYNDINWYQVGGQKAVVIVTGKNFFSGTSVVIGGKILDRPETGLVVKSETSLQLTIPVSALTHEAVLNARYGPSIVLEMDPSGLPRLLIANVIVVPLPAGQIYVLITLASPDGTPLAIDDVKRLPNPVLDMNGRFATATLDISQGPDKNVYVSGTVEEEFVKGAGGASVRLTFPFLGKEWSLGFQIYDIRAALWATRYVDGVNTKLWFGGGYFILNGPWAVFLDQEYKINAENTGPLKSMGPDLLELEVPTEIAEKYDRAFVAGPWGTRLVEISPYQSKEAALLRSAETPVVETKDLR
jgi:hypothetical protein